MTRKRTGDRKVQLAKSREKRLYPFDSTTRLCELVKNVAIGDLDKLLVNLSPYLLDKVVLYHVSRLNFDLDRIRGVQKNVYKMLADFLKNVLAKNGLRVKQEVFFRYLASPDHCNLGILSQSLKAQIRKEMKNIS